jgi:lysophospholipase L1-like esterase
MLTLPLLVLVLVEAGARLVVRARTPEGMVFADDVVYTYAPHARVGDLQLNGAGCVGDELVPGRGPGVEVLLLGGSTSFSRAYVDAVRARLRERLGRADVRVGSAGKPRYTSATTRVLAAELVPRLRPDAVAVYLGINDTIYDTFRWLDGVPEVGVFDWRDPRRSLFWALLRYHVVDKRLRSRPGFGPDDLRSPEILGANLEAVLAVCRANGSAPVLATFAVALPTEDAALEARVRSEEARMEHFWGRVDSTLLAVAAHNRVVAELAAREGVRLAPVADRIPRDGEHFLDMCHLTHAANQILGATVADAVAEALP